MDVDPVHEGVSKPPKPHDIIWLPDANVVLATDSYLFKVHKSVLSMQSSVFRDMFELPTVDGAHSGQSGAGMTPELYEGLPLVTMVGDKGEDVAHLLRVAYERQYYRRDNDEVPLEMITALLVLSTKYDFKHIRTDVIVHLSKHYPMDLNAYEKIDDDDASLFGITRADCHIILLKAVFTADVDVLLPVIFYACADYDLEFILHDHGLGEDLLAPECLHTLIKGREYLKHAATDLIAKLPDEGVICPVNQPCALVIRLVGLAYYLNKPNLSVIEGSNIAANCVKNTCVHCAHNVGQRVNEGRQKIWDQIPSYFGFPEWTELQEKLANIQ